MSTYENKHVK